MVPTMLSLKSKPTVLRRTTKSDDVKPVANTAEPWRIREHNGNGHWSVIAGSPLRGGREVAVIPNAVVSEESQANARLIAQAPAMHRAAVKLMCVWGTEDAQEAMEELAEILSKAAKG